MLCSLPQSYVLLITALEARDEVDLKLEFVKNKLIDEYTYRSESRNASSHSRERAYKVMNKNNKTKKFCTFCWRNNHCRSDCFQLESKVKKNFLKNDYNRKKTYNNSNSYKNNVSSHKSYENNKNDT